MATDGDFNVGLTSHDELEKLIVEKAKTGVFLSMLGYGRDNLKDSTMQTLANKGNGNYAYIDSLREARKVLVEQAGGTLQTIAKDVKLQVEFNPSHVSKYRLIGYEKRVLTNEDFNDEKQDSGEIGAGHTVTAFYEVFPVPGADGSSIDPLKYQKPGAKAGSDELLTVKVRYKKPEGSESQLIEVPVENSNAKFEEASADFKFAASVIGFSEKLAGSDKRGDVTYDRVIEIAGSNLNYKDSVNEYRKEFVELVKKARSLDANSER
jgi:Ca-activated chloride channel family protein